MDIEEGLRVLGALERLAADAGARPGQCWPKWRILLARLGNPQALADWWRRHGRECPRCRQARWRVEGDLAARGPSGAGEDTEVAVGLVREEAAPYAAAVPRLPLSPGSELPCVAFHGVEGEMSPGVDAAWLVVWDEALFVVVVGEEDAMERLGAGAELRGASGEPVGNLERAEGHAAALVFPHGAAPGRDAVVLQCDRPVGELRSRSFTIPELARRGIRLVPREEATSRLRELIGNLVARNRVGRFLSSLPREVESPSEALALSFYLRLLLEQGRLTPEEERRLADLPWLAEDLKARLRGGGGTGEDEPPA